MKKFSKRITMLVAILLCLVLITSSVVSTTLAKFVITKSATTSVGFTNFDMEVKLDVKGLTASSTEQKGDTLVATYNQLMLKPGDDFSDLFTITISGTATVKTLITVDVDIEYADSNFTIPQKGFNGSNAATLYMPAGFNVGSSYASATINSKTVKATPYASNAAAKTEEIVERALATELGLTYSPDNKNMTKTLSVKDEIAKTGVKLGIDWPADYAGVTNSNEIGTYLSLHTSPVISTFKIVITVEQVIT